MKRSIVFIVCILSLLTSCHKQEQLTSVDFGSGEFEEPFRGLLASHPSWLVATLDWPILRSLRSDTVVLSKTVEIGFNEDAIRSNSSARIFFVDENGYISKKNQVFCNQKPIGLGGYEIKASAEPQQLSLSIKIDPSIGDSTAIGYISIIGNEIDEVNTIPLTEDGSQNIAQWSFYHEIGWPMWIWIIWLLIFLLIVAIVVGIIYLLGLLFVEIGKGVTVLFKMISTIHVKNPTRQRTPKTRNRKNKNDADDNITDISNGYIDKALQLERILLDQSYDIASKNEVLENLRLHLEDSKASNPELNERCYQSLSIETQKALDKFNDFYGSTPKDSIGGKWGGERGKSTYVLSKQNAFYADCKKYDMIECNYNDSFEPDFSKVTHPNSVVDVADLYGIYTRDELKKRGGGKTSFQEVAQMRMARNLDSELKSWWFNHHKGEAYRQYDAFWEWRDANDLLPHEDANCKTMRLVKRPAHEAFTHAGGVSHARAIKKYFGG